MVFKYNSAFHSTINASSASVFLGRELQTTCDVILGLDNIVTLDKVSQPADVITSVKKAHLVFKKTTGSLPKQRYAVGQLVWRECPPSVSSTPKDAKFADRYDGPFRILEFSTPVSVCLYSEEHKTMQRAHVSKLKPCKTK